MNSIRDGLQRGVVRCGVLWWCYSTVREYSTLDHSGRCRQRSTVSLTSMSTQSFDHSQLIIACDRTQNAAVDAQPFIYCSSGHPSKLQVVRGQDPFQTADLSLEGRFEPSERILVRYRCDLATKTRKEVEGAGDEGGQTNARLKQIQTRN